MKKMTKEKSKSVEMGAQYDFSKAKKEKGMKNSDEKQDMALVKKMVKKNSIK